MPKITRKQLPDICKPTCISNSTLPIKKQMSWTAMLKEARKYTPPNSPGNIFLNLGKQVLVSFASDLKQKKPEEIVKLVETYPLPCNEQQFIYCLLEIPKKIADRVVVLLDEKKIKPKITNTEIVSLPNELKIYLKTDQFWKKYLFERKGINKEEDIERILDKVSWRYLFYTAGIFLEGWKPPEIEFLEWFKNKLER
ncbi:MAG: hypothetical protein NT030_03645 [Candidatus Saganbacteria bacterium]|nr:hypothetical protein [Candidatus Saganbacteria bacterium]